MAPLRQRAAEEGWSVPRMPVGAKDERPLTHVFLNGGKLSVWPPCDETDQVFADAYAQEVVSGRPVYAVEKVLRGGTYRFFADFDVVAARLGTLDTQGIGIEDLVRTSLEHLPIELRRGVAIACIRKSSSSSSSKQKSGAHIIWDDSVRVGDKDAMRLRDAWVANLEQSSSSSGVCWSSIIDAAVYKNNGLRMPWSLKCTQQQQESHYVPAFECVMEAPEAPEAPEAAPPCFRRLPPCRDAAQISAMVRRCSIRARPCPSDAASAAAASAAEEERWLLDVPDPITGVPESIETAVAHYWGQGAAASLKRKPCGVISCDSRRCYIKGGEHTSNRVYFVLGACPNRAYVQLLQYCYSERCKDAFVKVATFPKNVSAQRQR